MAQLHVSIVIVSYNNPLDVSTCLTSLAKSTYTDFNILICENGGSYAFSELQAEIARLKLNINIDAFDAKTNLGYAGGVNECIRRTAGSDAWWILNPDTKPDAGVLSALVEAIFCQKADAVGCTLNLENGTVQSYGGRWNKYLARPVSIGHGEPKGQEPDNLDIRRKQNYINGASMLVTSRFIEIAGFLREDYFLYCEEVEWCLRAVKRGAVLGFSPNTSVLHYQGTTTGAAGAHACRSRISVYLSERNKLLLTRDLYPILLPGAAVSSFMMIILRFGRRQAWRQMVVGLEGWIDGVKNRRGKPPWFSGMPS